MLNTRNHLLLSVKAVPQSSSSKSSIGAKVVKKFKRTEEAIPTEKNNRLDTSDKSSSRDNEITNWSSNGRASKTSTHVRTPSRSSPLEKYTELVLKSCSDSALLNTNVFAYRPTVLTKNLLATKKPLEFPLNFKCLVLSGEDISVNSMRTDRGFFLSMGKASLFFWDGCSTSYWKRHELDITLPKDTIVYAELVQELKGERRAQRRSTAFHIIDAMFLDGVDVRKLDYDDRHRSATKMLDGICKETDLVMMRVKTVFDIANLETIFTEKMDMRECKGGAQKFRLCFDVDSEKFMDTCGLLIFTTVNDKFICSRSRSSGKVYFFDKSRKQSVFDKPRSAVANFNETFASRIFWRWDNDNNLKEEPNEALKEADAIDRFTLTRFLQKAIESK